MKKIDKELMDKFLQILYVDYPANTLITDESSREALTWCKYDCPVPMRNQFYMGLYIVINKFKKKQKKLKKEGKLNG